MISCPECQAKNENDATVCQHCGAKMAAAPAGDALPSWLQALKPEGEEAQAATPAEAPVAVAAGATAPQHAARAADGTDTVVATQPTSARRAATAESPRPAARPQPEAPAAQNTTDTASLISEDDLPGWLRAFSETDSATTTAKADDQSWMTGGGADQADDALTNNLAQSWQAPARAAAPQRAGAVSVFGTPDESRAKVARVEKTERAIAPPPAPIAAAPEQKLSAPLPTNAAKPATPAAPARLGSNRAVPKGAGRSGAGMQRTATIAFILAFVIFLIVLGIFVVAPALGG